MFEAIKINPNAKMRETKWVQVCPHCQNERIISYCQMWNIKKGICSKYCKSCQIELGFIIINQEGLKLGRKYNNTKRKKYSNDSLFYNNLFNGISENTRYKQRIAKLGKRGSETNHWEGGKALKNQIGRSIDIYKKWRYEVFKRDNFLCQMCENKNNNKLNAHHIYSWSKHENLRYVVDNGITLCEKCHKIIHLKEVYGN